MSTDNKEVYIDQNAVALVDARIKSTKSMTAGLMSSWARPMEGVTEGPKGKITPPKPQQNEPEIVSAGCFKGKTIPTNELIEIPQQAMKQFKTLINHLESVTVLLTPEQAKMLGELISQMSTPKKMSDTKAIVKLSDQLDAVSGNI